MPSSVATILYLGLVAYLFRREAQQKLAVTRALWLPVVWIFVSATRFPTQWLDTFGIHFGAGSYEEGSPMDAVFFGGWTLAGIMVLVKRRLTVPEFVQKNQWVAFYLFFCLAACVWSDFPFTAFKRWTKLLGQVVMVAIVVTEPNPRLAIVTVFKRFAYLLIPLSFLFIKYYPDLGRGFDAWTGIGGNMGITLNKNILGSDCMIVGVVLMWEFLRVWSERQKGYWRDLNFWILVLLLVFNFDLLLLAQSSTSMFCLCLASAMMIWLRSRFANPRFVIFYLFGIAAAVVVAEKGFNFITFFVTEVLHRDMTLTDRTLIWDNLLDFPINPIFGTGFESFFLGERREEIWRLWPVLQLISAHNGYLQTYLDMGYLGLAVTLMLVLGVFARSHRDLIIDRHLGSFRLSYLIIFLFYNWTEVGFRMQFAPFFVFFLAALEHEKSTQTDDSNQADWQFTESYNEG